MDISSEIIHGVLPLFLVGSLGANLTTVGFIEGLGEGLALIVRIFSGSLSDKIGKRKPLLMLGYLLGTASKPIFAVATNIASVTFARSFDRVGKGLRSAPRDALIADVTPKEQRGAAYGLRQSLDSIGAFIGPALAILLLYWSTNNFRLVFWIAVIPGIIALTILIIFVNEPATTQASEITKPLKLRKIFHLHSKFWWVLTIGIIFTLARFSEAFLLLRAQSLGLTTYWIPGILALLSLFYAIGAYPAGLMSDRIGRSGLLNIGLVLLITSDVILAFSTQIVHVVIGTILWGLHMGFTQGIFAALVADSTNRAQHGTAFGLFGLATGLTILIASLIAGALWDYYGAQTTFLAGALFALLTLVSFLLARQNIMVK